MKPSHKLMTRYATSIAAANAAAAVAASHHPSNHLSNHSIATSRHHHPHQLNQINHLNLHHHHHLPPHHHQQIDSDEQEEEFEEDVEEDDVPIDLSVKSRPTTRSLPVIVRPEDHYDHHKIPLFRTSVTPSGAGGREAIHEQPQHHSHHQQQQQQDIINEFAVRYMFLNQSLGGANGVIAAAAASRHPALQSLLPTIAALSHHFPQTVTEDDLRGRGSSGWPVSDGRGGSLHSIPPHVLRENIQHEELDDDRMESPSPPIGDSTPNSAFASIGGGQEGLITDRKKMSRPLTGRYVRHGTGASPSTLMSLRRMIEERQKRRTSPSAKGNAKRNARGRNNNARRK